MGARGWGDRMGGGGWRGDREEGDSTFHQHQHNVTISHRPQAVSMRLR